MKFAIIGEGKTDFIVLKSLLIGYLNDKNLPISRLWPRFSEPGGWGNVLKYLETDEFKNSFFANDFVVIQIDSDRCEEWKVGINNVGDENGRQKVVDFFKRIQECLIEKIGVDFYGDHAAKIIFAICIHSIECWMLPFIGQHKAHQMKLVNCAQAVEKIVNTKGLSINQKNYQDGKIYEMLTKEMTKQKILQKKSEVNLGLSVFIDHLKEFSLGGFE